MGIVFLLSPRFVLPRFFGSVFQTIWFRRNIDSHEKFMIIAASGLVLGEGIMSIVTALLILCGMPVISVDY